MHSVFALVAGLYLASQAFAAPSPRATCSNPPIRKEWRELASAEKAAFISAVKCLSDPSVSPHSSQLTPTGFTAGIASVNPKSSRYDDFVYVHMDTNVKDHFTALFLPWHRNYLFMFEKALRDECKYTGYLPYWNWSLDTTNVSASPVFNPDPVTGLGTFGTAANNYTITDGAFAGVNRAYPRNHIIARNMTNYPFEKQVFPFTFTYPNKKATDAFSPSEVKYVTTHFPGDFVGFAAYIDGKRAQGMHNAAHLQFTPGDMSSPSYSPNDMIFFLHHANLDRIWNKWQRNSTANAGAFGGGSVQDLNDYDDHPVGAAPNLTTSSTIWTAGLASPDPVVSDVMSITGGYLCYQYTDTDIL